MIDRHDLTDSEWALLEPLLPDRMPRRGGRWLDHRQVINGVMWRTRTGSPWRELPEEYGNWMTVYMRHRRWAADGTWVGILDELRRGCDEAEGAQWTVAVDSLTARAHQHAAGAPRTRYDKREYTHRAAWTWRRSGSGCGTRFDDPPDTP